MEFIAHRINTLLELKKIPKEYGVEVDLRDFNERLILQHDPFKDGDDFETFLKQYNHGTMILNIKSEGIELKVLDLLKKYKIDKYFFLDSSFPMINFLSLNGEKNIALRFSEFEGLDTICSMFKKIHWVWVDCFSKLPITKESYKILKKNNFRLCLVSPELQNQENKLEKYKLQLQKEGMVLDAVCTKLYNVEKWKY